MQKKKKKNIRGKKTLKIGDRTNRNRKLLAGQAEEVNECSEAEGGSEEGRKYLTATPHFLCRLGHRAAYGLFL